MISLELTSQNPTKCWSLLTLNQARGLLAPGVQFLKVRLICFGYFCAFNGHEKRPNFEYGAKNTPWTDAALNIFLHSAYESFYCFYVQLSWYSGI